MVEYAGFMMGVGILIGYGIGVLTTWLAIKKTAKKKKVWDILISKDEK